MDHDTDDTAGRHRDGPEQRHRAGSVGLDLARLQPREELTGVVEYLTAIQVLRGDASSLLFVRDRDLDVMAERSGRPVHEFLQQLDQLGVVVSTN